MTRRRQSGCALGMVMICGIMAGCNDTAAGPPGPQPTLHTTASSGPTAVAVLPPSALLLAVEGLRADQAAVVSPEVRAAARNVRNAQLRAMQALSGYTAALAKDCGASTASFQSSLGAFRTEIATYDRQLDRASVVKSRLQADADRVAAEAKRAGASAPVNLAAVNAQYAALRADANARAAAAGVFETRAVTAHDRCVAKAAGSARH